MIKNVLYFSFFNYTEFAKKPHTNTNFCYLIYLLKVLNLISMHKLLQVLIVLCDIKLDINLCVKIKYFLN